jgi:hypothetical protein
MKTHRRMRTILSIGALTMLGATCGDDTMSMSNELEALANHQAALEADLTAHHGGVLGAEDPARIRPFENGFGQASLGHMGEMDHRMRDMRGMCSMGGHGFDGGALADSMGRARTALDKHGHRMEGLTDLPALRAEEGAFRETMAALMTEMRNRRSDIRASARGYTCRMHGH